MKSGVSLSLLVLAFAVSTSEANYEFTVRFYEFRNPLGLQCSACGSGGPPACCDDVQRNESCIAVAPYTCDTRIRFLLRSFRSPVETAPNKGYQYFTPSNGGNSEEFKVGPGGLLGLSNPFTFTRTEVWTGRIQFHVDAIDRPISNSNLSEMLAIINRFPIDLELIPEANFTERTTYTGIYNISGLGFDMSFRVQCSENYYGPNCTTFCEPMEGVYICDSEGMPICLQGDQNSTTFCTQCLSGWNPSPHCAVCLDPLTNCTICRYRNLDPSINCTTCLPGFIQMGSNCSGGVEITEEVISTEAIDHIDGGLNLTLVVGVAGGGITALVLIIVLLSCIIIVVFLKKKKTTYDMSDAASCLGGSDSSMYTKKAGSECLNTMQHDFKNPLYGPGKAPATAHTTNDEQYPLEQLLEVTNPFYGEFPDSTSQVGSKQGSQTSLEDVTPQSRLDTFPYVMDGENVISNSSTPHHQQRERVKHVVYEMADINVHEKPVRAVNGMYATVDKVRGKPGGVEHGMYETADKVHGKPMKAEDGMYEMADNVCGKSAGVKNVRYETADNVCGKPARAEGGKKESGVVIQGEEYDDIKTSGTTANVYDDIVSGKSQLMLK